MLAVVTKSAVLVQAGIFGPLVIGIALPIVVAKLTESPDVGFAFGAGVALVIGGYLAEWAGISWAMFREGESPFQDAAPRTVADALTLPAGTRVVIEGVVAPGREGVVDAPLT